MRGHVDMWSSGLAMLHLDPIKFLAAMNNAIGALPLRQVPYTDSQGFSDANGYRECELNIDIEKSEKWLPKNGKNSISYGDDEHQRFDGLAANEETKKLGVLHG